MDCFLWTESSLKRNASTSRYEPLQPYLFLSFLRFADVDVVLDIGANVGLYSLISTLSEKVEKVYSYEPDKEAFQELKSNIEINCLSSIIEPKELAVSDCEGEIEFGSHEPMAGVNGIVSSSIHNRELFKRRYSVQKITLDSDISFYLSGKCIALKIDVEGHETSVLKGALNLLRNNSCILQVENFNDEISVFLQDLGYFEFYKCGQDSYFTNISNLLNSFFVNRAIEHATTWLVETVSNRWPNLCTIKNSLSIDYTLTEDLLFVVCNAKVEFFKGAIEYAFYLIVDGIRKEVKWYESSNAANFKIDTAVESIEVTAFVREVENPVKKVAKTLVVKQKLQGYRSKSAIPSSLGIRSGKISAINRGSSDFYAFDKLDLRLVYIELKKSDSYLFSMGDPFLLSYDSSRVITFIPKSLYNDRSILGYNNRNEIDSELHFVSDKYSLRDVFYKKLNLIKREFSVILRAYFFVLFDFDSEFLKVFFAENKSLVNVYTDYIIDPEYKDLLIEMSNLYSFNLFFVHPSSEPYDGFFGEFSSQNNELVYPIEKRSLSQSLNFDIE